MTYPARGLRIVKSAKLLGQMSLIDIYVERAHEHSSPSPKQFLKVYQVATKPLVCRCTPPAASRTMLSSYKTPFYFRANRQKKTSISPILNRHANCSTYSLQHHHRASRSHDNSLGFLTSRPTSSMPIQISRAFTGIFFCFLPSVLQLTSLALYFLI